MKNPKTTITGIGAILTGLGVFGHALSTGDYSHTAEGITAIVAGIGLILAKDHNVTGGTISQ